MIRLDNIATQNSHQILFIDASMGVLKGSYSDTVPICSLSPFALVYRF